MDIPKLNPCPNCGNNSFAGFAGDETPYAILSAAKKENEIFKPIQGKVLGIIPVFCDKCGYVMLFKELD